MRSSLLPCVGPSWPADPLHNPDRPSCRAHTFCHNKMTPTSPLWDLKYRKLRVRLRTLTHVLNKQNEKGQLSLGIRCPWGQRIDSITPLIPKSMDAQVPYVKWHNI